MDTRMTTLSIVIYLTTFLNGAAFAATTAAAPKQACLADVTTLTPAAKDSDMARWQKERALYLHDSRLAALEQSQKPLSETDYDVANALLDADLYVAYAEADRIMLDNPQDARSNLQQAQQNLEKAAALAPAGEKANIETVKKALLATRESTIGCQGQNSLQDRQAYESLRRSIRQLVNLNG